MIEEAKASANSEKVGEAGAAHGAGREDPAGRHQPGARIGDAGVRGKRHAGDEFAYEMERNRSFSDLVPVAIAETQAHGPTRHDWSTVTSSRTAAMREQASARRAAKNYTRR